MINAQPPSRQSIVHKRDLLIILSVGIAAVVVWIITSVIENLNTTSLAPIVQQQVEPLNPAIDEEVLDQIEKRRFFSDQELSDFPVMRATDSALPTSRTPSPSPIPSPLPSPVAIEETPAPVTTQE